MLGSPDKKDLKSNFDSNSKMISKLEESLNENFNELKLGELNKLYKERQRIIKNLYDSDSKINKFYNFTSNDLMKFSSRLEENEVILFFHTSFLECQLL